MEPATESRSALAKAYAVLRVVLLVAVIGYLVWRVVEGRDALLATQPEWSPGVLLGAFVAAVLAYQCLLVAWLLLLKRIGLYRPGQLGTYAYIWWTSFMYRYVPGKVMLVAERARLGAAAGIPPVIGGSLTFVETLLAILGGSAVALFAVSYYAAGDGVAILGLVVLAVVATLLLPTAFRLLKSTAFVRRRFPEVEEVDLDRRDLTIVALPFVAHYLLLGVSFFLIARGVGAFTLRDLPGLCGIYALSHVISLVALIAPAGLGVREGALAVQLNRVLPGGVAEALAIGIRVWFTLVELLSYAAVLVVAPRTSPTVRDQRAR